MNLENTLEFDDQTEKCIGLEKMFKDLLNHIAKYQKLDSILESLTIVNDETIHKLNLEYRNTDRPTDVLSFSLKKEKMKKDCLLPTWARLLSRWIQQEDKL